MRLVALLLSCVVSARAQTRPIDVGPLDGSPLPTPAGETAVETPVPLPAAPEAALPGGPLGALEPLRDAAEPESSQPLDRVFDHQAARPKAAQVSAAASVQRPSSSRPARAKASPKSDKPSSAWLQLSAWVGSALSVQVPEGELPAWEAATAEEIRRVPDISIEKAVAQGLSKLQRVDADEVEGLLAGNGIYRVAGVHGTVREIVQVGERKYAASSAGVFERVGGRWTKVLDGAASVLIKHDGRIYTDADDKVFVGKDGVWSPVPGLSHPVAHLLKVGRMLVAETSEGEFGFADGKWHHLQVSMHDYVRQADGSTTRVPIQINAEKHLTAYVDGMFYVSTENRLVSSKSNAGPWKRELSSQVYSLHKIDGRLLATTSSGVFEMKNGAWKKLLESNAIPGKSGPHFLAEDPRGLHLSLMDGMAVWSPAPKGLPKNWRDQLTRSVAAKFEIAAKEPTAAGAIESGEGTIMRRARAIFSNLISKLGADFPEPPAPSPSWEPRIVFRDPIEGARIVDAFVQRGVLYVQGPSVLYRLEPNKEPAVSSRWPTWSGPVRDEVWYAVNKTLYTPHFNVTFDSRVTFAAEAGKTIWIGTEDGLFKWQGNGVAVRVPLDGEVRRIDEVGGRAYFSTDKGLWLSNHAREFTRIGEPGRFAGRVDGNLVAGREDGLYLWSLFDVKRDPTLPVEPALTLFEFGGATWLATERGIYVRESGAWQPKIRLRKDEAAIKTAFAHGDRLYVVRDGVLWDWTPGRDFIGEKRDPITVGENPGTLIGEKKRSIFSTLIAKLGAGFPESDPPPAPKPRDHWNALDALLSSRMGIQATEETSARLRRDTTLIMRGDPSIPLEDALARAFSKAHALVPAQEAKVPGVLSNHDEFKQLSVPWEEFRQAVEETQKLEHPHPRRLYVVEKNKPVQLLSVDGSIWQRGPGGPWRPIERFLEWKDMGRDNLLLMMPDHWAAKSLDPKRFLILTGDEHNYDVGDGIMAQALTGGIWSVDLPLPKGWRDAVLADVAAYVEAPAVQRERDAIGADEGRITGQGRRTIFSGLGAHE
jgi:hypothetical protein